MQTDQTQPELRTNHVANVALAALCVLSVLQILTGAETFALMAAVALGLFVLAGQRLLGMRERYLMVLAAGATMLCVAMIPEPVEALIIAAERAAYLATFMLLLSLLRSGAGTSASVLTVGRYLTMQPPGRRFLAIAAGGQMMGVIMNFGALSLLGPLVQRGARAGALEDDPLIVAIREQRQLSALIRGFAGFVLWSPTAIALLVALTIVTGSEHLVVAGTGAAIAALMLAAGWAEDRMTGLAARRMLGLEGAPMTERERMVFPKRAFGRLALVYVGIGAFAGGAALLAGTSLVNGMIVAAAPATVIWMIAQIREGRGDKRGARRALTDLYVKALPHGSPEAATLALAGFIGTILAKTVSGKALMPLFDPASLPPLVIYLGVTAIVPIASIAGLPPMLSVTFLGTLLSLTAGAALDPNLLALSLVLGWSINLMVSPFGASSLVLSRATGVPGTTLAFRWNGRFGIIAYGIAAAALTLLASL